jgi:peptidoglycan/LPS O-acetylase OafA/YrhL
MWTGRPAAGALATPRPAADAVPGAATYRNFGALRCGLALMVVLQHFQHLLPPEARAPFRTLGLGVVAVDVFFVLSGFIVMDALGSFYRGRPAAFLLNRLLRVVPPYAAAVALSVALHAVLSRDGLLQPWDYPPPDNPLDPTLIGDALLALVPGARDANAFEFIPFVWTLRIELAFYLAAAVAAQGTRRALPCDTARLAAACAILAVMLALVPGAPLALLDLPFFSVGICLHAGMRRPLRGSGVALAGAMLAACCAMARLPQPAGRDAMLQILLFLPLTLLTIRCAASATLAPALRRLDRTLGGLAYPLYLNHYVAGLALYDTSPARGAAPYVVAILLSIGLASLMHRLVDVPVDRFRDIIRRRPM